jgi:hypothetical protein
MFRRTQSSTVVDGVQGLLVMTGAYDRNVILIMHIHNMPDSIGMLAITTK